MVSSSPVAPEPVSTQKFPPFPLRPRGNMEIFDAAIKLYKQYFWVLIGWSAVVSGIGMIASTSCGSLVSLFLAPMMTGAIACCIAAAVRGQQVTFNQCWKFTQPRYGAVLGMYILASIIGGLACIVAAGICTGIFIAGAYALTGASSAIQITMAIVGFLLLGTIVTALCTVVFAWMTLVPLVVCLEEDKRNTQALGRAYDLLRGRWASITALMTVVGLSILALFAIMMGVGVMLVGLPTLRDVIAGREPSMGVLLTMFVGFLASFGLVSILFTPLYNLIVAVYYLDLRVRKEALDLEWAAHSTAPPAPTIAGDNTTIAPNESWQAPDAFTPEYSGAFAQPAMPAAPTTSVPAATTIDYSPHATRQLNSEEEFGVPEYSGAETPGEEATITEPVDSAFLTTDETVTNSTSESAQTSPQESSPPFNSETEPEVEGNEPNRW